MFGFDGWVRRETPLHRYRFSLSIDTTDKISFEFRKAFDGSVSVPWSRDSTTPLAQLERPVLKGTRAET